MISEAYRRRWEAVVTKSQRRAVDWMEGLDNARLLLTEEREKEIQLGVLNAMLERLRNIKSFELMDGTFGRGHAGSPDDMKKAVDEWLTQFIRAIRQT